MAGHQVFQTHQGFGFASLYTAGPNPGMGQGPQVGQGNMPSPIAMSPAQAAATAATTTFVQSLIPGGTPGVPHGSASIGSGPRRGRSRDKERARTVSAAPAEARFSRRRQMGPQETSEYQQAFENLVNQISALQNYQRTSARRSADLMGSVSQLVTEAAKAEEDIQQYKNYVEYRFGMVEGVTSEKTRQIKELIRWHFSRSQCCLQLV